MFDINSSSIWQSPHSPTTAVHRSSIVVAQLRWSHTCQHVFAHLARVQILLLLTTPFSTYKTAGITLKQVITCSWFSLLQRNQTRNCEQINWLIDASKIRQIIKSQSIGSVHRRIRGDCLNHVMSSHTKKTKHSHIDRVFTLLLNSAQTLEMSPRPHAHLHERGVSKREARNVVFATVERNGEESRMPSSLHYLQGTVLHAKNRNVARNRTHQLQKHGVRNQVDFG